MPFTPDRHPIMLFHPLAMILIASAALATAGCTALQTAPEGDGTAPLAAQGEMNEFSAVAKAARNNAIVLNVVGDEQPIRILPLPADGQPVYVSTLLKQSDLTSQFPRMRATLYRNAPDAIGGIRMGVRFHEGTNTIAPEHDYALRPGDRLQVIEEEFSPLEELGNLFGPSNARRALLGG